MSIPTCSELKLRAGIRRQFKLSIFYYYCTLLKAQYLICPDYLCCLECKDLLSSYLYPCNDMQTFYNEGELDSQVKTTAQDLLK